MSVTGPRKRPLLSYIPCHINGTQKEASLPNGHECRIKVKNLQPFAGNGDVSIWVNNSRLGWKKPQKQTKNPRNFVPCTLRGICLLIRLVNATIIQIHVHAPRVLGHRSRPDIAVRGPVKDTLYLSYHQGNSKNVFARYRKHFLSKQLWSSPEPSEFFPLCSLSVVGIFLFSSFFSRSTIGQFNQTLHKASKSSKVSSLVRPFPRGDNCKIVKVNWQSSSDPPSANLN